MEGEDQAAMKSVLAAQFWNEEVQSARSLDAVMHALPKQAPALGMVQGTHLSRSQQLLLLQRMLWIPCTPSYVVDSDNGGGLVLDRVLASTGGSHWWTTLTGRVRAQRLFGKVGHQQKDTVNDNSQSRAPTVKRKKWLDYAGRLLDSSLYALCLRSRIQLGPHTSLSASSELDSLSSTTDHEEADFDDRLPWRGRVALRHKMQQHHLIMEAAWHQCFVDREARYWEVPQAVSVDVVSARPTAGLRYRLGVHQSAGVPVESGGEVRARKVPLGALPGTWFQAAASLEKSLNLWKDGLHLRHASGKPYSVLGTSPHLSISGIVGGLVSASLEPKFENYGFRSTVRYQALEDSDQQELKPEISQPVSADLFASLGLSAQLGLFQRPVLDFTKLDVRVDLGAAAATMSSRSATAHQRDENGFPSLVVSLQQQVVGPVRARIDSRLALDPSAPREWPYMQELVYGLDYCLESLGAAKVCVWYSPTRREGMAELRILER